MATTRPGLLGRKFTLTTQEDVNAALHELGWLKQRAEVVEAETKQGISQLKEQAARELMVEIDGETLSCADRIAELGDAIEACWRRKAKKWLDPGSESKEFAHGKVGFRRAPDVVAFIGERDERTVLKTFAEKASIRTLIEKWLSAFLGKLRLGEIIRLKYELDKDAIKQAWQTPAKRAVFKNLGIMVETDRVNVIIEPSKIEVSAPLA
jgi:phage host-nuclease inhibitor protein Gam